MEISVHRRVADVMPYEQAWTALAALETIHVPPFGDLVETLRGHEDDFRFLVAGNDGRVDAIACFVLWRNRRVYWLGRFRLFSISVPTAGLFSSALLGNPDRRAAQEMLQIIRDEPSAKIIDFGDLPVGSGGFLAAVKALGRRMIVHEDARGCTRRLTDLSQGFDSYLDALRPSTRKAVLRDCRLFERLAPEWRHFATPDEAETFLRDAVPLSQRTFLVGIGIALTSDEATHTRFRQLADAGRLRAYIAYVDGSACAYAWGDISHDVFYFRLTGYDNSYRKNCAGTAMLFHTLADLANSRACARFDFGMRDMDYKQRFGTVAVPCTHLTAARWSSASALLAMLVQIMLDGVKSLVSWLIDKKKLAAARRSRRGSG